MMRKICWIDLTDLAHWKGHMTGIQRVVYNLAKHYHENGTGRFFMFDARTGFTEVSFKDVIHDEAQKVEESLQSSRLTPHKVLRGLQTRNQRFIKRSAKYVYRKSPSQIQQFAKQNYIGFRSRQEPTIIAHLVFPFKQGDVVFIPGASWFRASVILNLAAIKARNNIKIIHVVYDMIPELYPQFFGQGFGDVYIKHMFNALAISDHILAISQNTKNDTSLFQQKMFLPQAPITVFRLGDNPTFTAAQKSPDSRIEADNYILAVGTLEIRKNYLLLYYAWKKASMRGQKLPKLVIVGQPGWLSSDSMYLIHFDPLIRDSIAVLNNVSDKQLTWLYQNCMFTVYPSWYEGWGLPIAESMNYGKFCIASNTSSIPEIAGDILEYFDPFDVEGCLQLVHRYSTQPTLLKEAEKRVQQHYKKVRWDQAYLDCLKVTNQLLD